MEIIILIIVLAILEGRHDGIISRIQDPYSTRLIKAWHRLSFIYRVIVVGYILFLYMGRTIDIQYGLTLFFIGFLYKFIFDTTHNLYRNEAIWYIGTTSDMDDLLGRIVGKAPKLYYLVSFVVIVNIVIIYF